MPLSMDVNEIAVGVSMHDQAGAEGRRGVSVKAKLIAGGILVAAVMTGCSDGHSTYWQQGYSYATSHAREAKIVTNIKIIKPNKWTDPYDWCYWPAIRLAPHRWMAEEKWVTGCLAGLKHAGLKHVF